MTGLGKDIFWSTRWYVLIRLIEVVISNVIRPYPVNFNIFLQKQYFLLLNNLKNQPSVVISSVFQLGPKHWNLRRFTRHYQACIDVGGDISEHLPQYFVSKGLFFISSAFLAVLSTLFNFNLLLLYKKCFFMRILLALNVWSMNSRTTSDSKKWVY